MEHLSFKLCTKSLFTKYLLLQLFLFQDIWKAQYSNLSIYWALDVSSILNKARKRVLGWKAIKWHKHVFSIITFFAQLNVSSTSSPPELSSTTFQCLLVSPSGNGEHNFHLFYIQRHVYKPYIKGHKSPIDADLVPPSTKHYCRMVTQYGQFLQLQHSYFITS